MGRKKNNRQQPSSPPVTILSRIRTFDCFVRVNLDPGMPGSPVGPEPEGLPFDSRAACSLLLSVI